MCLILLTQSFIVIASSVWSVFSQCTRRHVVISVATDAGAAANLLSQFYSMVTNPCCSIKRCAQTNVEAPALTQHSLLQPAYYRSDLSDTALRLTSHVGNRDCDQEKCLGGGAAWCAHAHRRARGTLKVCAGLAAIFEATAYLWMTVTAAFVAALQSLHPSLA